MQPTEASFSPDGRWVVYQSAEPSRLRQLFVQPFPARFESVPAVEGNVRERHPFWNRKGSEIVINASPTMRFLDQLLLEAGGDVRAAGAIPTTRTHRAEPGDGAASRGCDA